MPSSGDTAHADRGCPFSDLARKDVCLIGQHPPLFHGQQQWKPSGRENFSSLPSLARVPVFLFPDGSGEEWEVALKQAVLVIKVTHLQGKEAALLWDSSQSD